ncbi:PREDICTED: uncharacterized protein LOC18587347 [Theobroma cacao]|uniref:Uncharacterized protein LOC18587347 n=1 Tax=Theobroma cacao TaxID=3641 RepID=A0AB32X2I8_THECC|nr:PREDICTED: uncharacterized protein LOC18587347 [Theobroma cacao]
MSMPRTDKQLSETLVMEILLKLPVKSLVRFKCVRKSWCSSFQTSYFITNYKNNNLNFLVKHIENVPRLSLFSTETEIKKHGGSGVELNLKDKENIPMPVSISSSAPITMFGPCNGLLSLDDGCGITLWNPSTREVKVVPKSSISRPPSAYCTYFSCIGFGFDSNYLIVSFNMAEEVFSTIPFPNFGMSKAECWWSFASFNKALATIVRPREGMGNCRDIWVLNGYLWTKQLTIGPILGDWRPLALWKNGELLLKSENSKLVMFDPSTGKLQDFEIHMPKYTTHLVVYAESIVPIRRK